MKHSISSAIDSAARAVTSPIGRGSSWSLYGPRYDDKPNGPSTEAYASSYAEAIARRTVWVSRVALLLLGHDAEEIEWELEAIRGRGHPTTVRKIVGWVHRQLKSGRP